MSNLLTQTFEVVVERQVTDLEMCLLALRIIQQNYPNHYDIAIEALAREAMLPELQMVERAPTNLTDKETV